MISLYRPSQPIEKDIPITAYEGGFGKRWERTKKNAAQIAEDLLSKYKYSKEIIAYQLGRAIRRINENQFIAGFVIAANLTLVPALLYLTHSIPHDFVQRTALAIAISPPGALSVIYIAASDRHKILYREIQHHNLENKTTMRDATNIQSIDDVVETR